MKVGIHILGVVRFLVEYYLHKVMYSRLVSIERMSAKRHLIDYHPQGEIVRRGEMRQLFKNL